MQGWPAKLLWSIQAEASTRGENKLCLESCQVIAQRGLTQMAISTANASLLKNAAVNHAAKTSMRKPNDPQEI